MEQKVKLDKDLIKNPRLWRLSIRIDEHNMHVVLFCKVEDNFLIYRKIPLDTSTMSLQKAIEEAIYENPLLLSDFDKIDCIIESYKFTIIPSEIKSPEIQQKIFDETFPDFEGIMYENVINEINATILMGIHADLKNFLQRTFNNPNILHHLTPLCIYFHRKSRLGNSGKMYAYLRDNSLDLLTFGKDSLLLANTFSFKDPMDAVYYILAYRQSLKLDETNNELFLTGNNSIRETITPILKKYVNYVMPVIFPSAMFKAGKDAFNAPFDLIILPLCE